MNQLEHGLYPFSETNLENFREKISRKKVVFRYKRQKDWRGNHITQANSLQQVVFILLLTLTDEYP